MNALVINCSPVRNGATAEIVRIISEKLNGSFAAKAVCIADYSFGFCKGCRSCHNTAECVQHDDFGSIISEFDHADIIVCVAPSYWADVPAQFKAFIDRCTPWCNTHEPHASLKSGKMGYAVALRTGPDMKECEKIIGTVEHFYGHTEIACCGSLGLCSVEYKENVEAHRDEILSFCENIIKDQGDTMLYLKPANTDDIEKEFLFVRDIPEDENGYINEYHSISRDEFDNALNVIIANSRGEMLPEGYVPMTSYFLWDNDTIVGKLDLRHYLCESLVNGAGHIGYYIAPQYRGKGYGTRGLGLIADIARKVVPEDEIYLRVNKDNPASLKAMLKNGGYIHHEDEHSYFVRIKK